MNTTLIDRVDGLVRGLYHNMWTAPLYWQPQTLVSGLGRRWAASPSSISQPLTICFLDLEGFTGFTSREGDEGASLVLSDHRRTVEPIVRDHDGRIVQHLGDGSLLAFTDAANAVDAALAIVNSGQGPLRVRAGLHTGTVLVLPDGDVLGRVVNVAARVAAATDAGDVVVTAETAAAAATSTDVQFVRLQRRRFKGIDGAVRTHRAVRARPARRAGAITRHRSGDTAPGERGRRRSRQAS